MFDPLTIGVGALIWMAFKKQANTAFGAFTPEREEVYKNAMEYLRDADKLRQLADDFEKEGLKAQAFCMRKRAAWRGRTPELVKAHNEIHQKALASTNIEAILDVAKAFEAMTATIKAAQLRERAKSLSEAPEPAAPPVVETTAEAVESKPEKPAGTNGMSGHTPKVENGELPADSAEA